MRYNIKSLPSSTIKSRKFTAWNTQTIVEADITDIKKNRLKEGDYICILDNSNIEHILKNNNIISYELLTLMGERLHRNY